jgi:hypothetical protein
MPAARNEDRPPLQAGGGSAELRLSPENLVTTHLGNSEGRGLGNAALYQQLEKLFASSKLSQNDDPQDTAMVVKGR